MAKKKIGGTTLSKESLIYHGIIIVLTLIYLIINSLNDTDYIFSIVFGMLFFIAGYFVCVSAPYFGLIFLFGHGGFGLFFTIYDRIKTIYNSRLLTDAILNADYVVGIILAIIIIGILCTILYNVIPKLRENIYFSNVGITFICIGLVLTYTPVEYLARLL